MTELSGYVLETLLDGDELALCRARQHGNPVTILVLVPSAAQPKPAILERLEHECALAAEISSEWAARPISLVRHAGRTMLLLEDPGGEPLRILKAPLELTRFLIIAVGLAGALAQVHRRGLIHKDVNPANVLLDKSDKVRLTGFGIASRMPRERQAPSPPEVIAGTLAYMAPEQTGRMNRSIDARSDLYSLGVMMYEMLTGALPFTAHDPLGWVHCHIARQPTPPSELVTTVPLPLSSIVMKLLAKAAEERYQTALGLEADLRRCSETWAKHGRIDPFPLGAHDATDRLLISEKLYGREVEIAALLASFGQVVADGTAELVLVSGYSGVGKSSVVNELQRMPRGLFAAGKFDQYKRDIPYTTLAQAFQKLVLQILAKTEEEVSLWRDSLQQAVGSDGQLIVNLIPKVEIVIGKQPPVPDLPSKAAQNRFQSVFRRFLGVFARSEHPLVLFLDDLQWLDTATLELLQHLATEPEVRNLLLIGAYRDNEVNPDHPLLRMLDTIRNSGARVREIVLAPLALEDMGRLVDDALHSEPQAARPLAQLVHEKTGGNPFFAIQFLMALTEEGLLAFDPRAAAWTWDSQRISAKRFTENVVDLIAGKLSRLPDTTQELLQQLACLGNAADTSSLAIVQGKTEDAIHTALWEAVRAGLVFRLEGTYSFFHDRVQEAAYALIPEGDRAAAHLRIGRVLTSGLTLQDRKEKIFEVVNQLDRATVLITSEIEREQVAELNLIAGKRAKSSTAHASALRYLSVGCALLTSDSWERQYDLSFALAFHRAECEFLTGNPAAAEELLALLSPRAGNLIDHAAVTRLRLDLYTTLDRSDRAVEVCLEYLRQLGIQWVAHPTEDQVLKEYEGVWLELGSGSIEELVDLPTLTDPVCRATLDVLASLQAPARFTDENLPRLIAGRMTNLSLKYGNSDASPLAYVWFGQLLTRFGDYQAGFSFGKLGIDLIEKRHFDRLKSRVYLAFGHSISPWNSDVRIGLQYLRLAFDTAQVGGDLTFAAYARNSLITLLLVAGEPLSNVQQETENAITFIQKTRFGLVTDMITGAFRLIKTLRGLTPQFGCFSDDLEFDESRFEHQFEANPQIAIAACWYWIRKMQARFFAREWGCAIEAALKAKRLLWTSQSNIEEGEYRFYGALAVAANYEATSVAERPQHLAMLFDHYKQLQALAENCPDNFTSRAALVGAEIARIEGRDLDAQRLYEDAIRSASDNGFVQNEGVAHEMAAQFYTSRGFGAIGQTYIRNARYCYLRWGALGKVKQLDELYPLLHSEQAPTSTTTTGTPVEQLDVATVVKASHALSSEIVLENLIKTLMKIAVEHAGAERGLLILLRGAEPHITADATSGHGAVEVTLRQAPVTSATLPESMLRYVIRTRESVILDDASTGNLWSDDEYVRNSHPRSVLLLPIIKGAKLIGVLYLENNLTPRAFPSNRIAILELLAAQAAISLENAILYSDLQQENAERKRVEEDLRRNEAYLAAGQRIIRTGSWAWNVETGETYWSQEVFRILGFDPKSYKPAIGASAALLSAEERQMFHHRLETAVRERSEFSYDYQILLPDGSKKYVQSVAKPFVNSSGALEYIGVLVDVTDQRRGEDALRNAQADLARVARLTTMGELAASIAHEVNQPLMAIVTNAETCLAWLASERLDLDEARHAAERVVRNGHRAGDIIRSIRSLARKSSPEITQLDLNEVIKEVLILMRGELRRHDVLLETNLLEGLQPVLGDRVQLQQVILNLIVNGIEAMSASVDQQALLRVSSQKAASGSVLIEVKDTGTGLDQKTMDRMFDAFFTTKPGGIGMGLSICRSIIESHGGRLWASPNLRGGSIFRFTVPTLADRMPSDRSQ